MLIDYWLHKISFNYIYNKTYKAKKKSTMRLTETAYIKGLNEGYALAKAQYENRKTSLYCSTTQYICQECNYKINRDVIDTPAFCPRCGCKFEYTKIYPSDSENT